MCGLHRQIVLLGVACGPGPTGQGDPYVELALQPLPAYFVPSDNVIMTCAAGTRSAASSWRKPSQCVMCLLSMPSLQGNETVAFRLAI